MVKVAIRLQKLFCFMYRSSDTFMDSVAFVSWDRCEEEDTLYTEEALAMLTQTARDASLRYAMQLIMVAKVLCKRRKVHSSFSFKGLMLMFILTGNRNQQRGCPEKLQFIPRRSPFSRYSISTFEAVFVPSRRIGEWR